jgi:hypothetical protein
MVVIPAHFVGGILGVTMVKLILGTMPLGESAVRSVIPLMYHYGDLDLGWQVRCRQVKNGSCPEFLIPASGCFFPHP